VPDAPHEVLLVLDATTGQNAMQQAKTFGQAVNVSGIVLTKLDGTAKGGIVIAIRHELDLPVKWIGLGEKADDLQPFDREQFLHALFQQEA
jgi:fused signal recognition particle receptor